MAEARQPHWLIVAIVGAIVALPFTWLGFNDWRFPGIQPESEEVLQPESEQVLGKTAPIRITKLDSGGIDITWSMVDDPDLHGYFVDVTAVRPVQFEYSVPRYSGDSDVFERHYPAEYLNEILSESGDTRRVENGQVWYVCVQGMKDIPLNTPIDDYIIPGTKACSEEFVLP